MNRSQRRKAARAILNGEKMRELANAYSVPLEYARSLSLRRRARVMNAAITEAQEAAQQTEPKAVDG